MFGSIFLWFRQLWFLLDILLGRLRQARCFLSSFSSFFSSLALSVLSSVWAFWVWVTHPKRDSILGMSRFPVWYVLIKYLIASPRLVFCPRLDCSSAAMEKRCFFVSSFTWMVVMLSHFL